MTEFVTPYRKRVDAPPACPSPGTWRRRPGCCGLSNEMQRQAAMIGYVNAFYLMAFTALIAVPLACLLRRPVHRL